MFLIYSAIIDTVKMDCMIRLSQINYAEPWLIGGMPDENSIKIFMVGSSKPVHALIPLRDFCERTGFLLVDTWEYQQNINLSRPRAINLENINLLRPYTVRREITNWVMYFHGAGNAPMNLHLATSQALRIQEKLIKR